MKACDSPDCPGPIQSPVNPCEVSASLGMWCYFCSCIPLLNYAEMEENCCSSHLYHARKVLVAKEMLCDRDRGTKHRVLF